MAHAFSVASNRRNHILSLDAVVAVRGRRRTGKRLIVANDGAPLLVTAPHIFGTQAPVEEPSTASEGDNSVAPT